ncbi:unnamed protein product [Tilletia controversa]|nr:unnamed protein product [Tilletia controversa]
MKPRLNTLMGQTQQELAALGDTTFLGDAYRGSLVLKRMTQFARDFVPPSTAPPSTSRPRNSVAADAFIISSMTSLEMRLPVLTRLPT